jgi:hypothetical protein
MLRKAYVAVSDGQTTLFAGQDWEIVSPLYPNLLNDAAGLGAGNAGYRRAMLRVDRQFNLCNSSSLLAQFGIVDNVLRDFGTRYSAAVTSSPSFQGRAAYSFGKGSFKHGKPITVGISSHLGSQRFTFAGNDKRNLKTWSFNADVDLPLTEKLGFQMEYFFGENLSTIEGGIMQGIDVQRRDTIRSQGGWVGLSYQFTKKRQMNFCYMIDDPFNEDVISGNSDDNLARNYNHAFSVNTKCDWNEALTTGFEVSFWRTHWQRYDPQTQTVTPLTPGTPTRYEFQIRYSF